MQRRCPLVLYVGLISLGLISVMQLGVGLSRGRPIILLAVALNIVLMVGLYAGQRWAFVLTILFSVGGVLAIGAKHRNQLAGVLLGNGFVVVPVLLSSRYFWDEPYQPEMPPVARPGQPADPQTADPPHRKATN